MEAGTACGGVQPPRSKSGVHAGRVGRDVEVDTVEVGELVPVLVRLVVLVEPAHLRNAAGPVLLQVEGAERDESYVQRGDVDVPGVYLGLHQVARVGDDLVVDGEQLVEIEHRTREVDDHGEVVRGLDALHPPCEVPAYRAPRVLSDRYAEHGQLQPEFHVSSGELDAVVPVDIVAERERPCRSIGVLGPFSGHAWADRRTVVRALADHVPHAEERPGRHQHADTAGAHRVPTPRRVGAGGEVGDAAVPGLLLHHHGRRGRGGSRPVSAVRRRSRCRGRLRIRRAGWGGVRLVVRRAGGQRHSQDEDARNKHQCFECTLFGRHRNPPWSTCVLTPLVLARRR